MNNRKNYSRLVEEQDNTRILQYRTQLKCEGYTKFNVDQLECG